MNPRLALLLLAACGGAPVTTEAPAASGRLVIVHSGRGEGEIEPCG